MVSNRTLTSNSCCPRLRLALISAGKSAVVGPLGVGVAVGVGVGVGVAEAGVDGVTDQASFPPGGRMRSKSVKALRR